MFALTTSRTTYSLISLMSPVTLSGIVHGEGSRSLYPASYPSASVAAGARAVTLTGFSGPLAVGQSYSGMIFSYTAPASGPVTVSTAIATAGATADSVLENDNAVASTAIGDVVVATVITGVPATADPGSTVSGSVVFSNAGPEDAQGVTYTFNIGAAGNTPTDVQFTSLPPGVGATYDAATGVVTLTGMPGTLVVGDSVSVDFSYTAPATDGARIEVSSTVATTSNDVRPANNAALAGTHFASNPPIAPPQVVPVLPWPALVLLVTLIAGVGRLRARQMHHLC